jgi:hypothetical protein
VHQTGVVAALGDDLLDALLLPEVLAADEVDLEPLLRRQGLSVLPDMVA